MGEYDLVIHRPNGSTGNLTEAEGNDTIGVANTVPTLPPCTFVRSEMNGGQMGRIPVAGFVTQARLPPRPAG